MNRYAATALALILAATAPALILGSPAYANVVVPSWVTTSNLVFDDEFNGSSLDSTHWANQDGWHMNNVTTNSANIAVTGGHAILTLASSSSGAEICSSDTSGDCSSNPSSGAALRVGDYAEARVSFPGNSSGSLYNWPAWWTSGPCWPAAGENDIAEVGSGKLTITYHYGSCGTNGNQAGQPDPSGNFANAFHVYGIYRQASLVTIYWDGKIVARYATDDNGAEESLLINVGNSTGPDCNCGGPSIYGASSGVLVDYVHVYRPNAQGITPQTNYGGPGDDGSGSSNGGGGGGGGGGTNLAQNPGFETNSFANWTNDGGSSVVSTQHHTGSYSVSIGANGVDQYISTSNGKTYNWSVWVKANASSTVQCGVNGTNYTSSSTSWAQLSGTATPGTTADFWCDTTAGTGYADDFSLSLPGLSPTKVSVGPLTGTIGSFTGTEYWSDGSTTSITVPSVSVTVPNQSATGSSITIPAQTVPTP